MDIPNSAKRCPYCHQPIDEVNQLFGFLKQGEEAFKRGAQSSSNSGCMVVLPLIMVAAYSIYYLISLC